MKRKTVKLHGAHTGCSLLKSVTMTDIFEDVLVIVNCLLMAQMKALGPRPETSELKKNSKIFIILEFFVQKVPFFRLPR